MCYTLHCHPPPPLTLPLFVFRITKESHSIGSDQKMAAAARHGAGAAPAGVLPKPPPAPVNSHAATFEAAARKLLSESSTVSAILQAITDISERLEIVHTSEYSNFLRCVLCRGCILFSMH